MALLFTIWGFAVGAGLVSDRSRVLFSEDFEAGPAERWVERGFPSIGRRNAFSLAVEHDGNRYLHVESVQSYSAKGVHLSFSPQQCPHVSWRWKVSNVIDTADLTRKEGDDAAAKLYVVFSAPSFWNLLDTRILVYVWDNEAPVGGTYPNAWLPEREHMVILESGPAKVGQWVAEQVHLSDDFKRAFPGEEPGDVQGLAFLADTDNTQSRVSAGFDDLMIRCDEPAAGRSRG